MTDDGHNGGLTRDEAATTSSADLPERTRIAIVGSGFSGMGMGIKLKERGIHDFVILERAPGIGGTWHHNTYPGCACDVPSHLYSFSFAPNPDWSHTYSPQPEIRAYLRRCAEQFGLGPHLHLRCEVAAADWDDETRQWRMETSKGPLTAQVLIAGAGPLHEPKVPSIPGLDDFEGEMFHSAQWDHDCELDGKRVASIGTGASAIQYVPSIQPRVEQLHVFQRTPPWVFPHTDRPITTLERRLYRAVPPLQRLVRGSAYTARELFVLGFVKNPRLMKAAEGLARQHMRRGLSDPSLEVKVTPDYTIGCKRILPSNKWYPALSEPNVELVTEGIEEVRPRSIVTEDGVEREVDTIIFGTGFHVTDMPIAKWVRGRGGRSLDDAWQGSPRAHLGTAIAGFPNLFMLLGPNTGLGHSSMVYMIESQVAHVLKALRAMDERGADTVEVRGEAADAFNGDVEQRMEGTVWNTGCASWYLDDTGRNATLWPDWTWRFRQRAVRFDESEYALGRREREPEPAAASATA
jgi:cation diffusion facilitator CzcD-associated flavoprotein CzcO